MLFLKAFVVGIGFMLGVEIALGLCNAIKVVSRGVKK
jgi:hypothetical protein